MGRTTHETENDALIEMNESLAFDLFSSEGFLTVNKQLLKTFGPEAAIYISNLVDKFKYFQKTNQTYRKWFFLIHADQMEQTGLNEKSIRKYKKLFIDQGVLEVKMMGNPAKEWYKINLNVLVSLMNTSPSQMGRAKTYPNGKGSINNINIISIKENKEDIKENIICPQLPDEPNKQEKEVPLNIKKPTLKERTEKYVPLAKRLSEIICSQKKITHTSHQLQQWANDIRQMEEIQSIPYDWISDVLEWYSTRVGGSYIPVVESGSSLKEKFHKLEAAIKREQEPKEEKPKQQSFREKYKATSNNIRKADVVYDNRTGVFTLTH